MMAEAQSTNQIICKPFNPRNSLHGSTNTHVLRPCLLLDLTTSAHARLLTGTHRGLGLGDGGVDVVGGLLDLRALPVQSVHLRPNVVLRSAPGLAIPRAGKGGGLRLRPSFDGHPNPHGGPDYRTGPTHGMHVSGGGSPPSTDLVWSPHCEVM